MIQLGSSVQHFCYVIVDDALGRVAILLNLPEDAWM